MTSFEELCVRWGDAPGDRRSLFVKKHRRQEDAKGEGQRLRNAVFIAGLPPSFAEESILKTILSNYGEIKTLALHPSKRSCMAVFTDASGVQDLLTKAKKGEVTISHSLYMGLHFQRDLDRLAWMEKHKAGFPGEKALQNEADAWMKEFEKQEEERQEQEQNNMQDDGWTVVTRRKKRGIELQGHQRDKRQRQETKQQQKKSKDYSDLYNMMTRKQSRIKAALSLRDQFEEDKKRVAAYRAKREFRG